MGNPGLQSLSSVIVVAMTFAGGVGWLLFKRGDPESLLLTQRAGSGDGQQWSVRHDGARTSSDQLSTWQARALKILWSVIR